MAIIQQYGGQKVQTQVVSTAKKQDSNPGLGIQVAQNVSQLAGVLQQKQEKMRQEDLQNRTDEALIQYQQFEMQTLSGTEDGYMRSGGLDSYTRLQATQEALQKKQQELADSLEGEARNAFDKTITQRNLSVDKQLMDHAARGLQAHKQSVSEAGVEVSIEGAGAYWDQTEPVLDDQGNIIRGAPLMEQYNTGRSHINDMLTNGSISEAEKAEKIQDYNAVFASSVVNGSMTGGSTAAKKSLDYVEGKGWLDGEPETRRKLESDIAKLEAAEIEQQKAQYTVATVDEFIAKSYTRAEANAAVKEIEGIENDPKLRADLSKQIKYAYDTKQLEEDELNKASFESASEYMYQGGSVVALQREQPALWESLTTAQKKSFESGDYNITDFDFWYNDIGKLTDEQLSKLRPEDYYHKLAKKERDILDKRVNDAKNKKPDAQVGQTRQNEVKETLQILTGKQSNKWTTPATKKQVQILQSMIDQELEFREKQKGYQLTPTEFSNMLSEFTTDYVLKDKLGPLDFDYTFKEDVDVDQALLIKQEILHLEGEAVGLDDLVERDKELTDTIDQIKQLLVNSGVPEENITDAMILDIYKKGSR